MEKINVTLWDKRCTEFGLVLLAKDCVSIVVAVTSITIRKFQGNNKFVHEFFFSPDVGIYIFSIIENFSLSPINAMLIYLDFDI